MLLCPVTITEGYVIMKVRYVSLYKVSSLTLYRET
jgi:hypothetical protein